MSVQQAFRLRNPALLIALAAVYPVLAYSAGAGSIDFSAGSVTAVNVAGIQRPLTKGAEISNGDTIRTGDGGRAQVRFSDGAMVSLQPQTEFRIDSYQYADKTDGQEKGFFSLLKGGMRTITGLIGRSNRDNYKVTTSVATIGIRGTEYTGTLNPGTGELIVNTGEGLVEVCNAAGCMLLASGESGIVSGASSTPRRTDSRPQLSPAQPGDSILPVYSASENRGPMGAILPVSVPLASGSGYALALVAQSAWPEVFTPGAATFDATSELQSFIGGSDFTKVTSVGSFSVDGVIGWGRWSSGSSASCGSLVDMHYVVGVPTSMSDLTALGGLSATYQLVGFTLPTGGDGTVGQAPSGYLQSDFNVAGPCGSVMNVGVHLSVPIAGTTYAINGTGTGLAMGPSFSFSPDACSSVSGFFAGANASHAGLTYRIDTGGPVGGYVNGAAAFKR